MSNTLSSLWTPSCIPFWCSYLIFSSLKTPLMPYLSTVTFSSSWAPTICSAALPISLSVSFQYRLLPILLYLSHTCILTLTLPSIQYNCYFSPLPVSMWWPPTPWLPLYVLPLCSTPKKSYFFPHLPCSPLQYVINIWEHVRKRRVK